MQINRYSYCKIPLQYTGQICVTIENNKTVVGRCKLSPIKATLKSVTLTIKFANQPVNTVLIVVVSVKWIQAQIKTIW